MSLLFRPDQSGWTVPLKMTRQETVADVRLMHTVFSEIKIKRSKASFTTIYSIFHADRCKAHYEHVLEGAYS